VASIFWVEGCNFRCPTCHNRDIAHKPPSKESNWQEEMKKVLDVSREWIDGVVISGGEPTVYGDELIECCEWIKDKYGLKICIHTNGSDSNVVDYLLGRDLVDLFCVDIKAPFYKYEKVAGVKLFMPGYDIDAHLNYILASAQFDQNRFLFRTTRVPFLTDEDMAEIKSYIPEGVKWVEQEYIEVQV